MNENETRLYNALTRKGFLVLRRGWPDFLVIGRRGTNADRVFALELKSGRDRLTSDQKQMHEILRSCGLPVYVTTNALEPEPWQGRMLLRRQDATGLRGQLAMLKNEVETKMASANRDLEQFRTLLDGMSILFEDDLLPAPSADVAVTEMIARQVETAKREREEEVVERILNGGRALNKGSGVT